MKTSLKIAILGSAVFSCLVMVGCATRSGPDKLEIFTEMHYSQAVNPQEPPRLLPPDGAVPITGEDVAVSAEAAKGMTNPVTATAQVLKEGADLYRVDCAMCHGDDAKGNGKVAPYLEKWNYATPPDLTSTAVKQMTDGQLFSIINFTIYSKPDMSPMPSFSQLLTQNQVWEIVNYLRSLQSK